MQEPTAGGRSGAGETQDARGRGIGPGGVPGRGGRQNLPETLAVGGAQNNRRIQRAAETVVRPGPGSPPQLGPRPQHVAPPPARPIPAASPTRPWLVPVLALLLIAVLAAGAALGYSVLKPQPATPAAEPPRITVGTTVDAARSRQSAAQAELHLDSGSFFACAEYRNAPLEAIYSFEVTPGSPAAVGISPAIAHGSFSGGAGNSFGCTSVQFDSGGPPAPGAYTLSLIREGNGGETIGHIPLTIR